MNLRAPLLLLALFGMPALADKREAQVQRGTQPALERLAEQDGSELPADRPDPAELALERGLEFLAKQQSRTGTGALPATRGEDHAPIGVTAIAALAWIGGGSSLTRGPYQAQLEKALGYLLDHQVQEGPESGYITSTEDTRSATHGHGLATLALTQAYSVSPRSAWGTRLGKAIDLAVRRIEASQGVDGGWYYDPRPTPQQEGSVTVCLVWALRGARNAGVAVDVNVIDRAIEYVQSLQNESGGFIYSHSQPTPSVALTAASLSTLHATGVYHGNVVDDGYAYLWRELGARDLDASGTSGSPPFPFYERMYLAQALWQHPDPQVFLRWFEPEVQRSLRAQNPDGSWDDKRIIGGELQTERYGISYSTAATCLVLAVPRGTLPVFTR